MFLVPRGGSERILCIRRCVRFLPTEIWGAEGFPGGPVVSTLCFYYRGHRLNLIPGRGSTIWQVEQPKVKKKLWGSEYQFLSRKFLRTSRELYLLRFD